MNPPIQQLDAFHSYDLVSLLTEVIKAIYNSASGQNFGETFRNFILLLPDYAVSIMMRVFSVSFVLSLILIFAVIWSANNMINLRKKMHDNLALPNQKEAEGDKSVSTIENPKWQKVLVHINSTNPSDWKLAILECDIMLGEILSKMGYLQDTIADKLKSVEPSDFINIENAWEAHKIRNAIAHEGSDFLINEREAKRVIGLYESVFREFAFI